VQRTLLTSALVLLGLLVTGRAQGPQLPPLMSTTPKPAIDSAKAVRSCESLAGMALPNTTVASAAIDPANRNICRVTAIETHPPTGDKVTIWIAIPIANWNGRFLGNGGGAFVGGEATDVDRGVALGFVSGATDAGHDGGNGGGEFALDANGRLNWEGIRDFAHVGIHDMTVTGKGLTQAMYGTLPKYSYWNGCSTGGRQGLMEAQRYPQDYDGIAAGAPAINMTNLTMQGLWGAVQMQALSNPVPSCKLAAATAAAVAACDAIDGVKDGVIGAPDRCTYDPKPLVGTSAGNCGVFTDADAVIIRSLWQGSTREDGSFRWYGHSRGADLRAVAATSGTPLKPDPFFVATDWLKYFITQNKDFDWTSMTPAAYQRYWDQSDEQYGNVIATDNPDLTAFRDHGGKTIIWHGWADELITAEGSIHYYKRVQAEMGGAKKTAEFARLFLAPGVGHCDGGPGPQPTGVLDALVTWVEHGMAPETLLATRRDRTTGAVIRSRPLCQYPLVAKYKGSGSTDEAANFVCSSRF
jgi:feruloyl esterase